jgi:hypothetical protein
MVIASNTSKDFDGPSYWGISNGKLTLFWSLRYRLQRKGNEEND